MRKPAAYSSYIANLLAEGHKWSTKYKVEYKLQVTRLQITKLPVEYKLPVGSK